jgi:ubiquinone/menaquinone biosynthesis C-methylase UbiE
MRDTKDGARRWFDRRAGTYEGGFTARWRDPVQRASLEALGLAHDDTLLDVGCGTGAASRMAAPVARAVVGVDLSGAMIDEAIGHATGLDNIRFQRADAEALPFADGSFTAVLCSNAFHHYPEPARAVSDMSRVLAPGGRIAIGDASADLWTARIADRFLRRIEPGHVRLYRSEELGGFLLEAGLSHVQLRRLQGGGFAIVRGIRR